MDFIAPAADRAAVGRTLFGDPLQGGSPVGARKANDIGSAVISGLQSSSMGLAFRGKMPDVTMDESAPWYHRAAAGVGGLVGDLVPGAIGALGGIGVGSPGGPIGAAIGGGAGAFAVPTAIREALVEAYQYNHALSWSDTWEIAKAGAKGFGKGAVIGGVTGPAGIAAGRVVGGVLAPAIGQTVSVGTARAALTTAAVSSELTALTVTASAMEGHIPTWQNFMDNAILLGGQKAAVGTAKTMMKIYAQTGRKPEEVVSDAARDPVLKAELLAETAAPAPGFVRMYHGGSPEGVTGPLWFTSHLPDAEGWAGRAPGMKVWTVDVPEQMLGGDLANGIAPLSRIEVPAEFANQRRLLGENPVVDIPRAYMPAALSERVKAALEDDQRPAVIAAMLSQQKDPQAKANLPVKYDYLYDPQTADTFVRGIAEQYAAERLQQTRGVVSVESARAKAEAALKADEVQPHEAGRAETSDLILARALLAKGSAENTMKLAESLPKDPAQWTLEQKLQFAGATEQSAMFYAQLEGAGAEAARSLNMLWQLKRDPSLLGDAETLARMYEKNANSGTLSEMAAQMRAMKTPEQVRAFVKTLQQPTKLERVLEPWRAGIFSGPQTWMANIMGNIGKFGTEAADHAVAASITAGRRALQADPLMMAQFSARALAPWFGLKLAVLDGLHMVAEGKRMVEKNGWVAAGKQVGKGLADKLSKEEDRMDLYKKANQPGSDNPIESVAGYFASASFGMLKAQDMPFRNIGERQEAFVLAVDRVAKEGFVPRTTEWDTAVMKYVNEPTLGLTEKKAADTMQQIRDAGSKAVFGERLGQRSERVSAAISGTPVEFLVPARRTPANIMSWAAQHTPGLNLLSGRWRDDFMAGGERRDFAIARVIVGSTLAGIAYEMVANGLLTGGGLTDREMTGTKQAAGKQNYSLVLDGKHYSIARMEPVAKPMMLVADLYEIAHSPKITDDDKFKAVAMTVLAFGNATISTTYLSGLANTMRAALDPDRYLDTFLESYATSLVPKIVGQPTVMVDPYKREVDGVMDAIQSQIPFLREQMIVKRDRWGTASGNERLFGVLPIATSKASQEKVRTEAVRLQVAIADAPDFVRERGPFNAREQQIRLTPEQVDVFRQTRGSEAMRILAPIVNSPDWDSIPDFAKGAIYRDVLKSAGTTGALKVLPADDAARDRVRQRIVDKINEQVNAVK